MGFEPPHRMGETPLGGVGPPPVGQDPTLIPHREKIWGHGGTIRFCLSLCPKEASWRCPKWDLTPSKWDLATPSWDLIPLNWIQPRSH